jgi:hypothetical protein
LTLYDQDHFFFQNALGRYSLGTKNKTLRYNPDGSLTLYAGAKWGFAGERLCLAANNRVGEGRHTMRVHSHATDKSSLGNKAPNPNNSATRGYSLTAFSVPLLPRPQVQLIKRRLFFRRKGKVLNAFFVREAGTPVECLYLVTFKHGETLAWTLHVTGNDRLGTTAIYLKLIDMHVVDEYIQKW